MSKDEPRGEVETALSRWTFGSSTPRDGDAASKTQAAARYDRWILKSHTAGVIRYLEHLLTSAA